MTARDIYLSKSDGLLYGNDPAERFSRGQDFLHPKLRFAFTVPDGFNLRNSNKSVYALGFNKLRIIFDRAGKPVDGTVDKYVGDSVMASWEPDEDGISVDGVIHAARQIRHRVT